MLKKLNDKELDIILNTITDGIISFSKKINNNGVVIGLSGGIDSALVAATSYIALGSDNILGVLMPSQFSTNHSLNDAIELATNLNIKTITVPIENTFNTLKNDIVGSIKKSNVDDSIKNIADTFDTSYENMQARIRGTILMTFSNKYNRILFNTGNRSESAMGYATMHGDMCGALAVIGELYKTEVFALSKYINKKYNKNLIPTNSIEKPPSAELRHEQKDSDSLPDYEILDSILELYIDKQISEGDIAKNYDKQTIDFVVSRYKAMSYKRQYAPPPIKLRETISLF